jgi:SanA protein
VREYFARTKAVLDLYIFNTTPRFLGEKQQLNVAL